MKKLRYILLSLTFFVLVGGSVAEARASASEMPVCPVNSNAPAQVRCLAHVTTDGAGNPKTSSTPVGYGPAQFLGAYNLSGTSPRPPVLAIVLTLDDPNIKADLDTFSATFNLPILPDCVGPIRNSAIPCFQKLDQRGGTNFSTTVDPEFALEMSLDVEMAHEICQNCSILLEEGDTATVADLLSAFDQAVAQGATVISNSWAVPEFADETSLDFHFNHPGIAMLFGSGDAGFVTEYPASSPFVTAVGGTTLQVNPDNTYGDEAAWRFGGSGCSLYEPKPAWQHDTGCSNRTTADVSADGDPATGAAIYDTIPFKNKAGWFEVGGTSQSTPLVAGVYALRGQPLPHSVFASSLPYANPSGLHDIIKGGNIGSGQCQQALYLCNAVPGYDGPTGLGSPNGTSSF